MLQEGADTLIQANGNLNANWVRAPNSLGVIQITSNIARANAIGKDSVAYYNAANNLTPDQWAQTQIVVISQSCGAGVTVRQNSVDLNCYSAQASSSAGNTRIRIIKYVNNVSSAVIATKNVAISNGSNIRLEAIGTRLISYVDGVVANIISDSSITTAGVGCGIYVYADSNTVSNSGCNNFSMGCFQTNFATANTLATDNFSSNGPLSINWTTGFNLAAPNVVAGNIRANVVSPNGTGAFYSGITWPNDQWSSIVIQTAANNNALLLPLARMQSGSNQSYYGLQIKGQLGTLAPLELKKVINGTTTVLTNSNCIISQGDTVTLQVIGNELQAIVNNKTLLSKTDSSISSGYAGLALQSPGSAVNVAEISNWSGGGFNYPAMDNFIRNNGASSLGPNWANVTNKVSMTVSSNNCISSNNSRDAQNFWKANQSAWPSTQYSQATLGLMSTSGNANVTGVGVCVRASAEQNNSVKLLASTGQGLRMTIIQAGVDVLIGSSATNAQPNDIIKLTASGNKFSAYLNNTLQFSVVNTAASISGSPGVCYTAIDSSTQTVGLNAWEGGYFNPSIQSWVIFTG